MKASWVIGIIGLILMNFGPVEPRMFMVPNQWLMEDMESVSPKVSQMKKVERPEVVQPSDIQPSDITFPKGEISAKGVRTHMQAHRNRGGTGAPAPQCLRK